MGSKRGPKEFVKGITYHGKNLRLPTGETFARRKGEGGDPSYFEFEVEARKVNGSRAFFFPEGQVDPAAKKHSGAGRAMASVVTLRLLGMYLRDRYAPAILPPQPGAKPVPLIQQGDRMDPKVAHLFAPPVVVDKRKDGEPASTYHGVYYPDGVGPGGDPVMVLNPHFYTTDLVGDDGLPMIVEGWAGVVDLTSKAGVKAKCPRPAAGSLPGRWPADTRVIYHAKNKQWLPVLEVRGLRSVHKHSHGKAVVDEAGKPVYEDERVDDLVRSGKFRFKPDGTWEVMDREIRPDSVYVIVPMLVSKFQFLVKTSKMGCASWNLPAGPFQMPVADGSGKMAFGGTCVASNPINLFERYEVYASEKREQKLEDGEQPPLQVKTVSIQSYQQFREKMGAAIVQESRAAEARTPGLRSNVSDYKDALVVQNGRARELTRAEYLDEDALKKDVRKAAAKQEKAGVPAKERDHIEWGYICSYCVTGDARVPIKGRGLVALKDVVALHENGEAIEAWTGKAWSKVTNAFNMGVKPVRRITTTCGREIRATDDHRILTTRGWVEAGALTLADRLVLPDPTPDAREREAHSIGHTKIASIASDGAEAVHDIGVADESHAFVANGLVVHNCYALKGNYGYLNQQFFQATRHGWAEAALEVDENGRSLAGLDPVVKARRCAFTSTMTEVIRSYYAPHRESTRLQHGEDPRYFRVHDAGDVFSVLYAHAWNAIAANLPGIKFWMPTRMWMKQAFLAAFQAAPPNMAIRPSALHFQDAAPVVPQLAAGSTANPDEQSKHWNCPAAFHDRGSCIGGMTVAPRANPSGLPNWIKAFPARETACRVCWGGHTYLKPELQAIIGATPVSYKEH